MVTLTYIIDSLLHLDKYLSLLVNDYGQFVYILLFLIIFLETGLVLTPFLPGDSLLFTAGAIAAIGSLNIIWLFSLMSLAAILGDTVNYFIGHKVGNRISERGFMGFVNHEHLIKTTNFYEKHGGKTIIIARFIPIIRTFAPFVAGIGKMSYPRFLTYNIIGGILWVSLFVFMGYFFGSLPIIKENFSLVILIIILLSFVPVLIEFGKKQYKRRFNP